MFEFVDRVQEVEHVTCFNLSSGSKKLNMFEFVDRVQEVEHV